MGNSDGFSEWDTKFFYDFILDGQAFSVERPAKLTWTRPPTSTTLITLAGTTVKQGTYLGGDAPINVYPASFSLEWSIFDKGEYFKIVETSMKTAFAAPDFIPAIWIPDLWYIPAASSGQTIWKTSRELPYDTFDITDSEYTPECYVDGVAQTLVGSSPPSAGEFYVQPSAATTQIELPSGIAGTWLLLRYPARFYIGSMELEDSADEENVWNLSAECEEHIPAKDYTFTVP